MVLLTLNTDPPVKMRESAIGSGGINPWGETQKKFNWKRHASQRRRTKKSVGYERERERCAEKNTGTAMMGRGIVRHVNRLRSFFFSLGISLRRVTLLSKNIYVSFYVFALFFSLSSRPDIAFRFAEDLQT